MSKMKRHASQRPGAGGRSAASRTTKTPRTAKTSVLANVGTAAAISNAVYHATGLRVRKLPIRIEDLLTA